MERNTLTTVSQLVIGDRFYKATDKKKTVLQMVRHNQLKTHFQTYNYWCKSDTDIFAQAIKGNSQVIFLRHAEPATNTTA